MKTSTKATLLSALVFPGMGHFYLKHHIVGSFIVGISFIPMYVLVTNAIEQAQKIVDQIIRGESTADISTMTDLVANQTGSMETQSMNFALSALVIIWLVAIIDAYRRGRLQDKFGL